MSLFKKAGFISVALILKANEALGHLLNSSTAQNLFNLSSTGENNSTGNFTSSTGSGGTIVATAPIELAYAGAGVIVVTGLGLALYSCIKGDKNFNITCEGFVECGRSLKDSISSGCARAYANLKECGLFARDNKSKEKGSSYGATADASHISVVDMDKLDGTTYQSP